MAQNQHEHSNGASLWRWRTVLVLATTLPALAWVLVYLRDSVRESDRMRAEAARDRNLVLARLAARALDREVASLRPTLTLLSADAGLVAACEPGEAGLASAALRRLHLQGGLRPIALYDASGGAVFSADSAVVGGRSRLPARAVPAASRSGAALLTLPAAPAGTVGLVLAVGRAPNRSGFLLSAWHAPFLQDALRDIEPQSGALWVADSADNTLLASPRTLGAEATRYILGQKGARHDIGRTIAARADGTDRSLISYVEAPASGCIVFVSEPIDSAIAPGRFLIRRLSYVVYPGFAVVLAAVWAIVVYLQRQQRLAHQLAEQNRSLEEADRAKSDFLANVSHDLRTPLTSLHLSITGLLDPEVRWDEENVRECLEMAGEQLDHLTSQVRNLLDMARLEAHSEPLHKHTCDLTDIVSTVLERLAPMLRGRAVKLDFPATPIFVDCDQNRMETVLVNLLENAAKYSPPGSAIHLRGQVAYPNATVSVRDEGPGIPPGDEQLVFDKFYRSSAASGVGGTGLGLSICRSIVELHGGTIWARNVPTGGAEFSFSIPLPVIDMVVAAQQEVRI